MEEDNYLIFQNINLDLQFNKCKKIKKAKWAFGMQYNKLLISFVLEIFNSGKIKDTSFSKLIKHSRCKNVGVKFANK